MSILADIAEAKVEQLRRQTVTHEDVRAVLDELIDKIRARCRRIADDVAPAVFAAAGNGNKRAIRMLMADAIDEALEELSQAQ